MHPAIYLFHPLRLAMRAWVGNGVPCWFAPGPKHTKQQLAGEREKGE